MVEVYGADIDIRDFSGKKAYHYLKSHYPEKNFEWVSWNSYDFIFSSNTFLTNKIFSYSDLFFYLHSWVKKIMNVCIQEMDMVKIRMITLMGSIRP